MGERHLMSPFPPLKAVMKSGISRRERGEEGWLRCKLVNYNYRYNGTRRKTLQTQIHYAPRNIYTPEYLHQMLPATWYSVQVQV